MSIDALTQAKSTLEGVRGALGIYSKTEVDMTLGMLDRAITNYTDLDAICQDLQEMTYTQAMRIAELEAKREWVGLTDEEVADIERNSITRRQAIRAIEAKLKEKNSG